MAFLRTQAFERFGVVVALTAALIVAGPIAMGAPAAAEPAQSKPAPSKPIVAQPVSSQPAPSKPPVVEPIPAKPAPAEPVAAEPVPPTPVGPEKVKIGLYITQLYDFDMAKRSFNTTFWAWFLHTKEKYKPLENIEVVNAKNTTIRFSSTIVKEDVDWEGKKQNVYWDQGKYTSTVTQEWDVAKFPFDKQVLNIAIEDGMNDISDTILEADVANSKIDDLVQVPGWEIQSFHIGSGTTVYNTTYGDPTLSGTSSYSRVVATVVLKRDGLRLLLSMFAGFFVAFALTCLTYFLDTEMLAGSRIGLSGGAIFASVGNKYVVDNYLPPASTFTLSDAIEISTFFAIVFSILVVVSIKAVEVNHPKLVPWVNRIGALLNAGGYLIYNGLLIMWAVN